MQQMERQQYATAVTVLALVLLQQQQLCDLTAATGRFPVGMCFLHSKVQVVFFNVLNCNRNQQQYTVPDWFLCCFSTRNEITVLAMYGRWYSRV